MAFALQMQKQIQIQVHKVTVTAKEIHFIHKYMQIYLHACLFYVCMYLCVCASHKPWVKLRRCLSFAVMTTTNTAEHQSASSTLAPTRTRTHTCTANCLFATPALADTHARTFSPSFACVVFAALSQSSLLPALPLSLQLAAYVNYLPSFFFAGQCYRCFAAHRFN